MQTKSLISTPTPRLKKKQYMKSLIYPHCHSYALQEDQTYFLYGIDFYVGYDHFIQVFFTRKYQVIKILERKIRTTP